MKRILSWILVACLFMSMMVCGVAAVEAPSEEKMTPPMSEEELDQLAATVFPEYADKILNPQMPDNANSVRSNVKVIDETRRISDSEYLTYQEYADGRGSIVFRSEKIIRSSTIGGSYVTYVVDFQVNHVYLPGSMYIAGFTYTTVYDSGATVNYDRIDDFGVSVGTVDGSCREIRSQENSAGPANIVYTCNFVPASNDYYLDGVQIYCIFDIRVGNDGLSFDAY